LAACYADDARIVTSHGTFTRDEYREYERQRMPKLQWINIEMPSSTGVPVIPGTSPERARSVFHERYTASDGVSSAGTETLTLRYQDGRWLITRDEFHRD
jgi:hypothetical protein